MTTMLRASSAGAVAGAVGDLELPQLSELEFGLFQRFLEERCGLHLPAAKMPLLRSRIGRRLRALGCPSYRRYYDLITGPSAGSELPRLFSVVTTHETHFFREPHHFELLRRHVLPALLERQGRVSTVRLWSAGCASGQEPWTLAAVTAQALAAHPEWGYRVLGTDIDPHVLATAREARYGRELAREIPMAHLGTDFLLGAEGLDVAPHLRRAVRFEQLNLVHAGPWRRPFDVIFCRNTMMYMHGPARDEVLRLFHRCLTPDGYFFLGTAESLRGASSLFRAERIGKYHLYRRVDEEVEG